MDGIEDLPEDTPYSTLKERLLMTHTLSKFEQLEQLFKTRQLEARKSCQLLNSHGWSNVRRGRRGVSSSGGQGRQGVGLLWKTAAGDCCCGGRRGGRGCGRHPWPGVLRQVEEPEEEDRPAEEEPAGGQGQDQADRSGPPVFRPLFFSLFSLLT
jgi:hypothetical protein